MRAWGAARFCRLALPFLVLSSCYHYRVAPPRSAPADDGHSVTRHAFVWGLLQSQAEAPDCQGNGVSEVVATTNLGYAVISVVTLGIWVPMNLEWKCAKDSVRVNRDLE